MKRLYKLLFITVLSLALFQNSVFSQSFRVDTMLYQGEMDYYINLVMLGDGYLESELPAFRTHAEEFIDELFRREPFVKFNNFFNAFSISVPSNEQGAAMDPSQLIDNYFGSTFNYAGIDRLLVATKNSKITGVLANNLPEYDQVFILVNSSKYGGSGGWAPTASMHAESKEIALHELGHSFAGLRDEYWAGEQYASEGLNMTQETDLELLKWRNWYGDNSIGLYPHSESPSWYRPHQSCLMRYLGKPFCSVCREEIMEQIYTMATPFMGYEPGIRDFQISSDSVMFKLVLNNPQPNTLRRNWYLNGTEIGKNVDSLVVRLIDLKTGENTLKATVADTSLWIRPYEYENYHHTVVEWKVSTSPVGSRDLIKILKHSALTIYPNPVHDFVSLRFRGDNSGEAMIALYDSRGSHLSTYLREYPGKHMIDLTDLEPGTYVFRIYLDGDYSSSRRIIKY
jgi:hypothetical protein